MFALLLACTLAGPSTPDDPGSGDDDGGASDGGPDTGTTDGGSGDGGDTGTTDGGTGDTGTTDGGSGDGGDTGVSDGGSSDGGSDTGEPTCDTHWYADLDHDGYGGAWLATGCDEPDGAVMVDGDCDDGDASVNPDGVEICGDGIDQDCSGRDRGCGIETVYSMDEADHGFRGGGDRTGLTVGSLGDFDGDGHDDLVIQQSTPPPSGGEGRTATAEVALYYGGSLDRGTWNAGELPQKGLEAGKGQIDLRADLDGDGYSDMVWLGFDQEGNSALDISWGSSERWTAGGTIEPDNSVESNVFIAYGQRFDAGDADGDGIDDIFATSADGAVLIHGAPERTDSFLWDHPTVIGSSSYFGDGGIGLADLDGDGLSDMLLADVYDGLDAFDAPGAIYVMYSDGRMRDGLVLSGDEDAKLVGPTGVGLVMMGSRMAAGDLDGDGYAEVAASAPSYASGRGMTWVFSGGSTRMAGTVTTGEALASVYGESTPILGVSTQIVEGFERDGSGALMLGATHQGALVFDGATMAGAMTDDDAVIGLLGGDPDSMNGYSTTWGDLDGDGTPDLVTAGYGQDGGHGHVWVFSGAWL